jgi:hypothetical protein
MNKERFFYALKRVLVIIGILFISLIFWEGYYWLLSHYFNTLAVNTIYLITGGLICLIILFIYFYFNPSEPPTS